MTVKELFKQVEKKKLIEILKEHFGFVYKPQDMDQTKAEQLIRNFYITAIHEMVNLTADIDNEHILCVIPYMNEWDEEHIEIYQVEVYKREYIEKYQKERKKFPDFYRITFEDWKKILGMQVAGESLKKCGEYIVAAAILEEMTFFGCFYRQTREEQKRQLQELQNRMRELNEERSKTYSIKDVFIEVGAEPTEIDLLEEEKRQELLEIRKKENINRRKDFLYNLSA